MRVLYFCPSEGMYGDNIALMNIIPHLIDMGVEPYFIVVEHDCPFVDYLRRKRYKYYVVTCRIWQLIRRNNYFVNWVRKLFSSTRDQCIYNEYLIQARKIVDHIKPSIIHSNSSNSRLGYELAKRCGIVHVWHLREYAKLDAGMEYFPSKQAFIRDLSDRNYCIAITSDIKEYFGGSDNIKVIYDGVVDESIPIPEVVEKKKQFIFCGRLTPKKGIENVILAFSTFCKYCNEYILIVLGDGTKEYVGYLHNLIARLNIQNKVKFYGYQKNISRYMAASKAFIMASEFEAFGFTTAEAMYNGTCVIGHNTGGTKLQFDNAKEYCGDEPFFRYNNISELFECMSAVANETVSSDNLRMLQKCVVDLYGAQKSAAAVFDYYRTITLKQ